MLGAVEGCGKTRGGIGREGGRKARAPLGQVRRGFCGEALLSRAWRREGGSHGGGVGAAPHTGAARAGEAMVGRSMPGWLEQSEGQRDEAERTLDCVGAKDSGFTLRWELGRVFSRAEFGSDFRCSEIIWLLGCGECWGGLGRDRSREACSKALVARPRGGSPRAEA